MNHHTAPERREPTVEPLDVQVDHIRGLGRLILEYGDYECTYSLQAYRGIERVEFATSEILTASWILTKEIAQPSDVSRMGSVNHGHHVH
jgi:hypothetical protein